MHRRELLSDVLEVGMTEKHLKRALKSRNMYWELWDLKPELKIKRRFTQEFPRRKIFNYEDKKKSTSAKMFQFSKDINKHNLQKHVTHDNMQTQFQLLLLWQMITWHFLPRETLGLGPGKINFLPWRTPGKILEFCHQSVWAPCHTYKKTQVIFISISANNLKYIMGVVGRVE